MLRKNLKPLYLAGMLLATPAYAQTNTTQRLVSQGIYWHEQGRDDLASETWKKLLSIDPNQPDALLGLGQAELAQGRHAEARKRLQQLDAAHPRSAQGKRLRLAISGQGGEDPNLREARRAAAAGRYVEAVRRYEVVFDGKAPPAALAVEYYQSLAGTPRGWERARDGLGRLRNADAGNSAAALALAQLLTYREPSRREGIAQLATLSQRADVAAQARASWRQALLWLAPSSADAALYQAFLVGQPNDAQITAKLAQVREQRASTAQADPNATHLGEGFKALNDGNLAVAEQRFTQVLRTHARDPEALGGLGSVRLRQQRFSEAQELLQPAAASNAKWRSAYDSARYWRQLQQAEAARARGDVSAAAQLLQQSIRLLPKEPGGYAALGSLQAGSDDRAAEASYRKAMELDASNVGAIQGLVALYSRQGRMQEASELFARLSPAQREQAGGEATLRANVQRARAKAALEGGDAVGAQTELEAAMVARPGDPWIRLDLARLYQQAGRPDQARSVMDGLLAVHGDLPEALHANALLAQETGDWQGAYASVERIPPAARTAEMSLLRNNAWLELQARQGKLLVQQGRAGEAQLLLSRTEAALADQLDQPQLLAALAGAYADAGNPSRALTLGQRLISGAEPSTEDRLQYAGVLLRAKQDAELSAVLRQLHTQTMTPEQLRRYQAQRSGYTLRQVDALRELGNLEGAYDALAPLLTAQPRDAGVLGALARLYSSAGDQRQALTIYRQILQIRPNDLDVLTAAANSAAAQSDMRAAEAYLQRALALAPDSPDVLAAAGRVYRSAGKNRKAEQYFRASLAAQQRQAGQLDNASAGAKSAAASHAPAAGALNPFSGMTGPMPNVPVAAAVAGTGYAAIPAMASDGLPPPVSAAATPLPQPRAGRFSAAPVPAYSEAAPLPSFPQGASLPALPSAGSGNTVLDELRQVQSENSDNLAGGAVYRSRGGEAGMGQMDDVQMPLQAEFSVGEGKLGVQVTPTLLDAGEVPAEYATASRFGAGPTASLSDALAADSSTIDTLVGSSVYQLLLTEGATTATQNLLYDYAVESGRYNEIYNDTDSSLTNVERRAAALQTLYAEPLSIYLLGANASATPIATLASALLNDSSIASTLASGDASTLQQLAASSAASSLTPTELSDTLYGMAANGNASRRLGQDDSGVGVAVSYRNGGFRADVGSTPIGFQEQNVVGGVGFRGRVGDRLSYSVDASRRPVNDSVLSFAGTTDARNGREWGGVTSSGVTLSGTLDSGLLGGYANLAVHKLKGSNVADNEHRQMDLGFYVHALETDNTSLTAGINLTAMQYDKNLSGFTYGHGGYFSPQSYMDLGFPVHWSGRSADHRVAWKVDASVGVQHFRTDAAAYFPTDATLQQAAYDAASLAALLGLTDSYTEPVYAGLSKTGVSYNLAGAVEWQVASQLFLGGRLTFNNARDYKQFNTNLYLRFVLDRLGAALGRAPEVLASPYANEY